MMKHAKRGGFAIRSMIALSDEYRHAEPPYLNIFNIDAMLYARYCIVEKRTTSQSAHKADESLHIYYICIFYSANSSSTWSSRCKNLS